MAPVLEVGPPHRLTIEQVGNYAIRKKYKYLVIYEPKLVAPYKKLKLFLTPRKVPKFSLIHRHKDWLLYAVNEGEQPL